MVVQNQQTWTMKLFILSIRSIFDLCLTAIAVGLYQSIFPSALTIQVDASVIRDTNEVLIQTTMAITSESPIPAAATVYFRKLRINQASVHICTLIYKKSLSILLIFYATIKNLFEAIQDLASGYMYIVHIYTSIIFKINF